MQGLEVFIVAAKRACYVGGGASATPCRQGSHDLTWAEGDWSYRDSYFGGTDFLGQETVWLSGEPVWAMNYYGFIARPELIDGHRAGLTIKAALAAMYAEGRFLGGYDHHGEHGHYQDRSEGDYRQFFGEETISIDGAVGYRLVYHGGLVRP